MSLPSVVPVVCLIVPALIGPEKVVVPMSISCLGLVSRPMRLSGIITVYRTFKQKERGNRSRPNHGGGNPSLYHSLRSR